MKLFEYQAKKFASRFEIPIPRGGVASSPEEARKIAEGIDSRVVIKAQVLVAGRGKAGGVKTAETSDEAFKISRELLGSEIKGEKVKKLIVEEAVPKRNELYLAITVDRSQRCYVALASLAGGMDIEEVAAKNPERIVKKNFSPTAGMGDFECRQIARALGFQGKPLVELAALAFKLHKLAFAFDAELAESNPVIETPDGNFLAADLRMIIDDNALYRHPEAKSESVDEQTDAAIIERKAREKNLAYVELDGNIGIIGNGAGLVMATLDLVKDFGGKPANFCDLGGGASPERVLEALKIVLASEKVDSLLVNIMGGITRCDDVAKGIVQAVDMVGSRKPMVVRLVGTNQEEGKRILENAGIRSLDSMEEAATRAVQLARGS